MRRKILWEIMRKNLITQFRAYPVSFFVSTLLNGFFTVFHAWMLETFLFQKSLSEAFLHSAGTGHYLSYAAAGSLVYLFSMRTCLNVSRTLITELRQGTLESLMMAPFHRVEYFLGNMLVQTITTSFEVGITALISILFGADFSNIHPVSFLLSMAVSLYSFFGLSMVLGCIMLYMRDTYLSQNTLFAILFLVCGITFPVEFLPGWAKVVSVLIPVTGSVRLIRASLLLNVQPGSLVPLLLKTAALSTAYVAVGFLLMKKTEKIALENIFG